MQIVNCCIVSCCICVTGSARGTQLRSTQHHEQVYSYCVTEQSSPSFFMVCGFTSRQCSSQPESCSHPRLPAGAALSSSWVLLCGALSIMEPSQVGLRHICSMGVCIHMNRSIYVCTPNTAWCIPTACSRLPGWHQQLQLLSRHQRPPQVMQLFGSHLVYQRYDGCRHPIRRKARGQSPAHTRYCHSNIFLLLIAPPDRGSGHYDYVTALPILIGCRRVSLLHSILPRSAVTPTSGSHHGK